MPTTLHQQIMIPAGNKKLTAELTIPADAHAIIIFARSGADAHLNRHDRAVATRLQNAGFGTLLSDLLTDADVLASAAFDIDLLTTRLLMVTRWVRERDLFGHYRLAYFAVSMAAAAAIQAAVCQDEVIDAIVCCSGRTDLAAEALPELQPPALLIAGSLDRPVLEFNREALALLTCPKRLEIIQGAMHLPGATNISPGDKPDELVALATQWFNTHLKCLVS
jgi:pimeloyl-ACP methyl ester carboxylesterase